MLRKIRLIVKYALILVISLLMLGLFDSNPSWKVLLYSLLAFGVNIEIKHLFKRTAPAFIQGISAAFLAYLLSLTPYFRTTLSTLIGFTLLFSLAEYLYERSPLGHN